MARLRWRGGGPCEVRVVAHIGSERAPLSTSGVMVGQDLDVHVPGGCGALHVLGGGGVFEVRGFNNGGRPFWWGRGVDSRRVVLGEGDRFEFEFGFNESGNTDARVIIRRTA